MKRVKKILSVILFMLLATILFSCGNNSIVESSSNPESENSNSHEMDFFIGCLLYSMYIGGSIHS